MKSGFFLRLVGFVFFLFSVHLYALEEGIYITVKNGERMRDFEARLISREIVDPGSFLKVASEGDFSEYPHVPGPVSSLSRFEGLFAPGQYFFSPGMITSGDGDKNALCIVTWLLHRSASRFRNWKLYQDMTLYHSIILASIVEKEAAANRHYGLIASVFYNRLLSQTRLSSCPAVEYALGYHRPFLSYDDIAIDSPYNLYLYKGLPPTPISFFSEQAVDGVSCPPVTDLFYFVFDWTTGELYFSGDYETHVENSQIARANYTRLFGDRARFLVYENKYYEF